MMDRRQFLKMLGSAGPVIAVNPTYFFAPAGGWRSNVIENPYNRRLQETVKIITDWEARVTYGVSIVDHDRIYHVGHQGIFENGILISSPFDPEAWLPHGHRKKVYDLVERT